MEHSPGPGSRVSTTTAVASTALAAALAVLLVVLDTAAGHSASGMTLGTWQQAWYAAPLCLLVTVACETVAVSLPLRGEVQELNLSEVAVVVCALVLPGSAALATIGVAAFLASWLVRRQPFVKGIFNISCNICAAAPLVLGASLLGERTWSWRVLVVTLAGAALFSAINLVLVAWVLQTATGESIRGTVTSSWRLSAVMALGGAGTAGVALALIGSAPALLPFVLMPVATLMFAYHTAVRQVDERERSERLLGLLQRLADHGGDGLALEPVLEDIRFLFSCDSAILITPEGAATPPGVPLPAWDAPQAGEIGRSAPRLPIMSLREYQPGDRILFAPVEGGGRRIGTLAVRDAGQRQQRRLLSSDLLTLGPLATALGSAMASAENLRRLTEESAKLQAVVDHSSDGILVVGPTGIVAVWNPAMEALTGLPAAEAVGHTAVSRLELRDEHGEPFPALSDALAHLSPATPRYSTELCLVRSDGEERWVRTSHTAVYDEQDALVRDVVLVHDITRARQTERLKSDFVATVSHELRTPITPIKGYIDLLRKRGDHFTPEKRAECLDLVADRVAHLARLVEDLLQASRVSTPSSSVVLGTGDLAKLTRTSVGDFSAAASRLSVTIPDGTVPIRCDPVRIVQVINNLVGNALKYSPSDSPVSVELELGEDGRRAAVRVTDAGRGIPADQLETVFEKFHRVEDAMTMTTSGTGLGLYIARQLAEAMGGTITVTSTLGVGSTFTFSIPVTAEDPGAAPEPTQRWGPPAGMFPPGGRTGGRRFAVPPRQRTGPEEPAADAPPGPTAAPSPS
ncbi:MAG: domain S-box protein [Mycobacterium sp.]|nr:domain S-box protein [Mycobacterium sp.]